MSFQLEPDRYYHIYNRGNNREKLFYREENYEYFLSKFQQHCYHVIETYAFCLMGNHFHFLISIRPEKLQEKLFVLLDLGSNILRSPSKHLSNLFNSYTQSINNQEGRTGSLFQRPFKRKEVESQEYFQRLLVYIHQNPLSHRFVKNLNDYPYSSFSHYLNKDDTFINKQKALTLFGGIENFIAAHSTLESGIDFLEFE